MKDNNSEVSPRSPRTAEMNRHGRRKLIEVSLPLDAINRASAAEKMIHVGTPSNLHAWWARRPLAACRAVAFASAVDDPGEYLPPQEAEAKRRELFALIEQLVGWDATENEAVLEAARKEILNSSDGELPTVIDPFCGSGTIPLEALRLGFNAVGCDLNPIAVAISKALVEVPHVVTGHSSIGPREDDLYKEVFGLEGFRSDLSYYSKRIFDRARAQVEPLYAGSYGGSSEPIAWLWCRTAQCPNPGCNTRIPLISSLWLSKTKKSRSFLRLKGRDSKTGRISVDIINGDPGEPGAPPLNDTGAVCPTCETPVPFAALRDQGRAGNLSFQLNAYVTKTGSSMNFHAATPEQEEKAMTVKPGWAPETMLPDAALGFRVQNYGLKLHRELFLPRQLAALSLFATALDETIAEVRKDAGADAKYADAVCVYLAIFFDRLVQTNNALVRWFVHTTRPSKAQPTFDKQTVQMIWDFAETNPLADSTGGWITCCKYPQTALDSLPQKPNLGRVLYGDSGALKLPPGKYMFSTDPPYFDNIGYADLSDFFYIWMRRILVNVYPDAFGTILVPKDDEIISDPSRHDGDRITARKFFYERLGRVFGLMHQAASTEYPTTIFYAFKQEESTDAGGVVSSGWERMLQALIDARWSITGTWPIRTEHANRPRSIGANALASSIVLVCRPRSGDARTLTRREFITALKTELPVALSHLQRGNIAPVDLAQAAIGPGMAVYSRCAQVLDAGGQSLNVREALAIINETLDEAMAEQEGDFDSDSRWALAWFEEMGFVEGEYGVAETLSKAKNTSVSGLVEAGIVVSSRGRVRLLKPSELAETWDPDSDPRMTTWEMVHHLIRVLEVGGESATSILVTKLGSKSDVAKELAYRLYTVCERKKRPVEALSYNGLVQSWPEITRLALSDRLAQPAEPLLI
jgi:putative DNA methylase